METASHTRTNGRTKAFLAATTQTQQKKVEIMRDAFGKEIPISEYFGCMTFGLAQMREKLPRDAYGNLITTLEKGKNLSRETADAIANAVKEWSVAKGVTHFCHWFQPMTGSTAEKHDAFISIQHSYHSEIRVIERFSGSQLIQGEPDASSFPSGGVRSTFEARGYTAWDPSSPLFILEEGNAKTLCIPTVFCSYHGLALDNKTPLLRSVHSISHEACEFLKLIGDVDVKRVQVTLGAEQEYFLIDKNFVSQRPDIIMTGRSLLGAAPARGQQLEDHYFGSIPARITAFMQDVEFELYKLGIPIKTRHNEVAPSQFELAPIFEDVNIAADHNILTMEILKRVALKHGLVCLLHEKPFAGINGSGKHNNWSIANDKGENLLEPGTTPHQNKRFLAVLAVILKAVHDHAPILRAAIASAGNDHRLGANEAPPAIISVFLGELLEDLLNDIEKGKVLKATDQKMIDFGVGQVPQIPKDNTDRNRTSPFAFTGNKFEFRAVGSTQNVSVPMTMLNAAVAYAFRQCTVRLKELLQKKSRDEAVMELIRQLTKETKTIRFSGDGYSKDWQVEAKKRGLPILKNTAEALDVFTDKKAIKFLTETKILTSEEIESRHHIAVERYVKTLDIEHKTLSEMVQTYVIPSLEKQLVSLGETESNIQSAVLKKTYKARRTEIESAFADILEKHESFKEIMEKGDKKSSENDKMHFIAKEIKPASEELRDACDRAETLVADDFWCLPKYREMLLAHSLT